MRLLDHGTSLALWVSARETRAWARGDSKVNGYKQWPCSQLAGKRFFAAFDRNGLVDISVNGRDADINADEFNAVVSDFLALKLKEDHPLYFVTVGQFRTKT